MVAAAAVAGGLEMAGGGRWAPGEWTDDTAMVLELAESIGTVGMLDTDDLARRYIRWARTDGKGIGRTTRGALIGARDAEHARARARAHYEATELAAGNGTVMRATPIGLAAHDLDEAVDAARRDAQLTHADPAASAASAALCAALLAIREGGDPLSAARGQIDKHPSIAGALDAVGRQDESALGAPCSRSGGRRVLDYARDRDSRAVGHRRLSAGCRLGHRARWGRRHERGGHRCATRLPARRRPDSPPLVEFAARARATRARSRGTRGARGIARQRFFIA